MKTTKKAKIQKISGGVAVVLGTRPEIIKMSPVIRSLAAKRVPHALIHTGQHYSYEMDRIFFKDLELPEPNVRLDLPKVLSGRHGASTGWMMEKLEEVFLDIRPKFVLIQGDTNSVLAGALAASKIEGIHIGHIEAGLRSYDRRMPEESNRIVADHLSDYLFAPTPLSARILRTEGIPPSKIQVTGNTVVDALKQNARIAAKRLSSVGARAARRPYAVLTLHRQENVDRREVLAGILDGLDRLSRRIGLDVVFPAHPRTAARLKFFGLTLPNRVCVGPPVGYLDFLNLQGRAAMMLTDSGGVQEEACVLGIPCLTLRTTTERPETVEVGANRLAGHDPERILREGARMFGTSKKWRNPFGDGRSAERIVMTVRKNLRK